MQDLEQKRQKIEKIVKVTALCVAGFIFAPFAILTIKGLISLIVVGSIGLLTVNVGIPWMAINLANWRLKALKAAAAANPIEMLENIYAQYQTALIKTRDNIKKSYAILQQLFSAIQEHNEKFPNSPSQYLDKYNKLKQLIELQGNKYKVAQTNLEHFGEVIEEKRSDWKIAQTMAEASKLANVGEDFQTKMLKDTALTTVQDGLNLAFSELDVSLLDAQPVVETTKAVIGNSAAPVQVLTAPSTNGLDLGFESDSIIDVTPAVKRKKK